MADYTDAQKLHNYRLIMELIEHIRNGHRITEDWMDFHKKRILLYRDFFGDLSLMNPDCKDRKFRQLADDTEMTLNHLVWEIQETGYFTVDVYLKLNVNLKMMFEIVNEVDELAELMNGSLKF